ncbi:hypothetical protein CDAR_86641 [Caerostris darwini]|uniref:Protein kinase domain-containing protein n=1 Tax=Caerostris darwini TaxID=1538125 RepID=A0AAV4P564_9ARAC|nr:hypothetical protein CDAR_86641 [Caerostris darwini]
MLDYVSYCARVFRLNGNSIGVNAFRNVKSTAIVTCIDDQDIEYLGKKGEGSFAEVMACQNLIDGQLYACKTLKRHFVSVDQALGLTEVRALRRLRPHVNIVQLHDIIFDKKSGRLALIFELMDLNMYELLKARKKPLPEFRVKSYIYQLIRSLDHIHRHGIFHRDVKPENLLIRDNLLKLADFGSCRGINTKRPYTEYISTRWYRPPECLLTSGHYTYKMDMWAAGCVFFEALTNLPLFPGSSELDQLSKIHNVLGTPKSSIAAKLRRHIIFLYLLDQLSKIHNVLGTPKSSIAAKLRRHIIFLYLLDQLSKIHNVLGTPKSSIAAKLRRHKRLTGVDFNFQPYTGIGIAILAPGASPEALELLISLVSYDEDERPSARQALKNPYFLDLRLAEKYQHSGRHSSRNTGKRTSSASKQSSPLSPRSGPVSRVDDASNPTREKERNTVLNIYYCYQLWKSTATDYAKKSGAAEAWE